MTEFVILYGKKYPKSLIRYLLSKPNNEGKSMHDFTEKYLDEMKEVVKEDFYKSGVGKGTLYSFYPYIIPLWMDIADAKGYKLVNIKQNPTGVQADVVKNNQQRKKRSSKSKIKICKCKR